VYGFLTFLHLLNKCPSDVQYFLKLSRLLDLQTAFFLAFVFLEQFQKPEIKQKKIQSIFFGLLFQYYKVQSTLAENVVAVDNVSLYNYL